MIVNCEEGRKCVMNRVVIRASSGSSINRRMSDSADADDALTGLVGSKNYLGRGDNGHRSQNADSI